MSRSRSTPDAPTRVRSTVRDDQIRWGALVASVLAVFAILALGLAAYEWSLQPAPQKATPQKAKANKAPASLEAQRQPQLGASEGKLLVPDGDNCRVRIFDNKTGRSSDGGIAACAEETRAGGKYDYPASRLKSIRSGFSNHPSD